MDTKIALSLVNSPNHAFPGHPESPNRFTRFEQVLDSAPIVNVQLFEDTDPLVESIAFVHTDEYIIHIREAVKRAPLFLDYGDTYATPQSYEAALDAVNGTLSVTGAITRQTGNRGFALVRPPGHHANQHQAMGFCLFNNVAIGAKSLQKDGYAKLAIYDFDVHHGNGTQDIFYDDPNVLYISSHQWGIYPGTGRLQETGEAAGIGATLNIPLPAYSGDQAILQCYEQLIHPSLERFDPDFMLISAGFDAHWSDPLANLQITTSGYYQLASHLISAAEHLCEGRIAFVLEGGYDPEALADNVGAVLHALANQALPNDRLGPAPIDEPAIGLLIEQIRSLHKL